MKITKKELKRIIRENIAMRMTQDRMRKSGSGSFSEPRAKGAAQKRKGNEPITRNHVVKNSFKGTSSDRVKLEKELKAQIEKMIKSGKEDQVPSNWRSILSTSNGDHLLALKQAVNPGILKKVGRFLGMSESLTEEKLRQIIREVIEEDVRKRGNQYCAYVDDKVTKKDKENNPKLYKGKKAGSVKRTKSGKIKMKARACYASKKKANNAMAAAMM